MLSVCILHNVKGKEHHQCAKKMGKSEEPLCSRPNIFIWLHHCVEQFLITKVETSERDKSPPAKLFASNLADCIRTKYKLGSLSHTHTQWLDDRREQIWRRGMPEKNIVGHGTPAMVHTHCTVHTFALENIMKLLFVRVSPYSRRSVSGSCCAFTACGRLRKQIITGALGRKRTQAQEQNCWFELYLQFALICLAVALDNCTQSTLSSLQGHSSSQQVREFVYTVHTSKLWSRDKWGISDSGTKRQDIIGMSASQ